MNCFTVIVVLMNSLRHSLSILDQLADAFIAEFLHATVCRFLQGRLGITAEMQLNCEVMSLVNIGAGVFLERGNILIR